MASEFEEFLKEMFEPLGGVVFRRMFGGLGIFKESVMFALVERGTLRFRVDATSVERYRAAGSSPFVYAGKPKPVEMPYWSAPESLFDDRDEFAEWAREAHAVALRLSRDKAAKKARRA